MNAKITTLGIACALALAACGGDGSPPAADREATPAAAPATEPVAPTPVGAPAPVSPATPAPDAAGADPATPAAGAASDAGSGKPAAEVSNCSTTIEGNDAMQFDVGSIAVPSSCSEFTITLNHVGRLPEAAMGHNVVVSLASDRPAIAADGVAAGPEGDYLKDGDDRVIAHTEMIGGGETTSVTFPVSAIQGDGPYEFFCSFPGHWAVMRGSIQVQ